MKKEDRIKNIFDNTLSSIESLVKILIKSKRVHITKQAHTDSDEIVILANGPSLNQTIADSLDFVMARKRLAVNFAANSDLFQQIKPQFYVLADPHFFNNKEDKNVANLWEKLSNIDWDMTLYMPTNIKENSYLNSASGNKHLKIEQYNLTPIEGFEVITHATFTSGYGMPRPRNVLIPSIMIAMQAGFKTIYIAGADHSWSRTISVNDNNEVISIQPHFYKDSKDEQTRVNTEYMNYPLHQIMHSFYVTFKSYHTIQHYAQQMDIKIYNITPNSFIDAFPRTKIL
ncbi:MAG: hypothetical protein R3Y22_07975 [Bacteroidales bacterium]